MSVIRNHTGYNMAAYDAVRVPWSRNMKDATKVGLLQEDPSVFICFCRFKKSLDYPMKNGKKPSL